PRPATFGAGSELLAQADIRERPAHHHFVVPAPRAVRIEVVRLDAMLDQIPAGRAVLLDGPRRRDVVRRDAVTEQREHPAAGDVAKRRGLKREPLEERRIADVGGVGIPYEA